MPKVITNEIRDQIIALTAAGRTNKEIMDTLCMSKTTIQKTRHLYFIARSAREIEIEQCTRGNRSARLWAEVIKASAQPDFEEVPDCKQPINCEIQNESSETQDYKTKYQELVRRLFLMYCDSIQSDDTPDFETMDNMMDELDLRNAYDKWIHRLPDV